MVISSTGTGKTYLSAFDARNLNQENFYLLYIENKY